MQRIWDNGQARLIRRHDNATAYQEEFEREGCRAFGHAYAMLHNMEIRSSITEVTATIKTPTKDLGIKRPASYHEIVDAAKSGGLNICPGWVAPEYLLNSDDRMNRKNTVIIATKPILNFDGDLSVFYFEVRFETGYGVYFLMSKTLPAQYKEDTSWLFTIPDPE